jgi:hypothetical protein
MPRILRIHPGCGFSPPGPSFRWLGPRKEGGYLIGKDSDSDPWRCCTWPSPAVRARPLASPRAAGTGTRSESGPRLQHRGAGQRHLPSPPPHFVYRPDGTPVWYHRGRADDQRPASGPRTSSRPTAGPMPWGARIALQQASASARRTVAFHQRNAPPSARSLGVGVSPRAYGLHRRFGKRPSRGRALRRVVHVRGGSGVSGCTSAERITAHHGAYGLVGPVRGRQSKPVRRTGSLGRAVRRRQRLLQHAASIPPRRILHVLCVSFPAHSIRGRRPDVDLPQDGLAQRRRNVLPSRSSARRARLRCLRTGIGSRPWTKASGCAARGRRPPRCWTWR